MLPENSAQVQGCIFLEVGVCPYLKVHVEMKDKSPFFVCPYRVKEDQKKWVDKEMWKGCLLGYMR